MAEYKNPHVVLFFGIVGLIVWFAFLTWAILR